MYSRSYKQGDESISIPESYGGIAFREPEVPPIPEDAPKSLAKSADIRFTTSPEPPDPKLSSPEEITEEKEEEKAVATGGFMSSFMEKLPIKNLIPGFDLSRLKFPKIGTEEILIIGLALFLFLSRDGDKECAILLLLLLLIQ